MRRYRPARSKVQYRCRWCGVKLGDWHHKECSPGQAGDGRVADRDCVRLTYLLHSQDAQTHLMHSQLREQWERGEEIDDAV
jgi:hypothetical protein